MEYYDELLNQAFELLSKEPTLQTQADFRRSVSTAYYAIFHFLINEAVVHWDLPGSRNGLARMFEHRVMKTVSKRTIDPSHYPFIGEDVTIVAALRSVAEAFIHLQDNRHIADYDMATLWTKWEALNKVEIAAEAFTTWHSIRHQKIAQDYLVALLIKPRD